MENEEIFSVKKTTIAELAIAHYGRKLQTVVAMEELAELIQALSKAIRKDFVLGNESVAEEIADVEIMLEQLKQIFSCREAVNLWLLNKCDRQYNRIMKELENGNDEPSSAE